MSGDAFDMLMIAVDKNDERRSKEYAQFLNDPSSREAIAVANIYSIVRHELFDYLCNFQWLIDGYGNKVYMADLLAERMVRAEEAILKKTGVNVSGVW